MNLAQRKPGSFLKPALDFFLIASLGLFKALMLQFFAAKIAVVYLEAYSMSSYLSIFFGAAASTLGGASLIVINLNSRRHLVKKYVSGAFFLFFLIAGPIAVPLFVFEGAIANYLKIGNLPYAHAIYAIRVATGFLFATAGIGFFIYSAIDRRRRLLLIYIISFTVDLSINVSAMGLNLDEGMRFLVLCCSNFTCSVIVCLMTFRDLWPYIQFKFKNIIDFYSRSQTLLFGQSLGILTGYAIPLLFSKALDYAYGGESIAAFNVAMVLFELLLLIVGAIELSGITWLTDIWGFRGEPEWFHSLKTIKLTAVAFAALPLVILIFGSSYILHTFYNLHSMNSVTIASLMFISAIPAIITADYACLVQVLEKLHIKSTIDLLLVFFWALPILYFFGRSLPIWAGLALGWVLPHAISALWLYAYGRYLNRKLIGVAVKQK